MSLKKATDEQIIEDYQKTNNIWKTAKNLGMCGQSIYERLIKLNKLNKKNYLTETEKEKIRELYKEGFKVGDKKLDRLSKEIHRTKTSICRFAKKEGLTNPKRNKNDRLKKIYSERAKKYIKNNGHPRGFLKRHFSKETREKISKKSKEMWKKMSIEERISLTNKQINSKIKKYGVLFVNKRKKCSWKAKWRTIGHKKIYFRSQWEANYARYLEYLKQNKRIVDWDYEKQTFLFKNSREDRCFAYVPDFKIITKSGDVIFHEVKGWYDERSRIKIRKMRQDYPSVTLKLIREKQYKKIKEKYANKIPNWEY